MPLWLEDGKCPNDKRHFKRAAREVYGYIRFQAQRHGGFVFASVPNITKHTKVWADKNGKAFSQRECERILRAFRVLGILDARVSRTIHKRKYNGWQFHEHDSWAFSGGGMCEFRHWERYEASYQYLMGNQKREDSNYEQVMEQNDGADDGTDDGINDGGLEENVGVYDGAKDGVPTDVLKSNAQETDELQAATKR